MASNDNDKDNSDTSNTGKRGKNNNASRNRSAAAAAEDDDTASAEREPPPYMYDPRQFQNPHPPCQPVERFKVPAKMAESLEFRARSRLCNEQPVERARVERARCRARSCFTGPF